MASYLSVIGTPARYLPIGNTEPDLVLPDLTSGRWVFLFGPAGCGKTHRAVEILHAHFARVGKPRPSDWRPWHHGKRPAPGPLFVDWPGLLKAKVRAIGNDEAEDPILTVLGNRDVVLLDDVATERPTDFAIETLGEVISDRYNAVAPTVLTSNRSLDEIAATYGKRIASRISEAALVADQSGTDWRLAIARGETC